MTDRHCRLIVGGGVALLIALTWVAISVINSEAAPITNVTTYVMEEPDVNVVTTITVATEVPTTVNTPDVITVPAVNEITKSSTTKKETSEATTTTTKETTTTKKETTTTTISVFKWDGPVLNSFAGMVQGPSGNETYYNLDMSGVVSIMKSLGYDYEYWVRDDGVKMYGDYVMCAADLSIRPKGTIVETSLGLGIVCDTGGFVNWDNTRLDIAVNW